MKNKRRQGLKLVWRARSDKEWPAMIQVKIAVLGWRKRSTAIGRDLSGHQRKDKSELKLKMQASLAKHMATVAKHVAPIHRFWSRLGKTAHGLKSRTKENEIGRNGAKLLRWKHVAIDFTKTCGLKVWLPKRRKKWETVEWQQAMFEQRKRKGSKRVQVWEQIKGNTIWKATH